LFEESRAIQVHISLNGTALAFHVGMLHVPAVEDWIEQLANIEIAAAPWTIEVSNDDNFHDSFLVSLRFQN
jgi:hypothetical protein